MLRSNYWLVTHVMTIALSYAAFALALGIANITLGYYLFRSDKLDVVRAQPFYATKQSKSAWCCLPQVSFLVASGPIIRGDAFGDGIRRKSGHLWHFWAIWPCFTPDTAVQSAIAA